MPPCPWSVCASRSDAGRSAGWLALAALLALPLAARAAPASKPVPAPALAVRELLALAPQAVAQLSDSQRAVAREQLARALANQAKDRPSPTLLPVEARLPPAVQLPLSPSLQKVLALDLQRRARKQDPILVATILVTSLKPQPAPALLEPLDEPTAASAGLILPADLLPSDAAALRRICERASPPWLTLLAHATVRLTAGVPFAVMMDVPDQAVYVNPVLLALLATPKPPTATAPDAAPALPIDLERELTYRSVADCAAKLQAACRTCVAGDATQCAAMRATFAGLDCKELGSDSARAIDSCVARALKLRSVSDCVAASEPACLTAAPPATCRDRVDVCIANPDAGAEHAGSDDPGGPAVSLCVGCGSCSGCNRQCADSCGDAGREMSRPCGESCADKCGQTCNESCSECNKGCQSSCAQADRDFGCTAISRSVSQCSRDCASCNRQCSQCNSDCSRSCNQCNSDCSGCGSQCNQCSRDCNQCGNDCNQCNSDCNQCGTECNQCGNDCNQCNGQCNDCNQCSAARSGGLYPSFPVPPGPAAPPPPLVRTLLGARASFLFVLPPLLFLWWRRRLHAERRARGQAAP